MKRITLHVVILGGIGFLGYFIAKHLFTIHLVSNLAAAAFWGAFFSFLFVKAGDTLERFIEKRRKHYNMFVRLEYAINEYLSVASFNISNLDGLFESISKTKKSETITVQYLGLKEYKIDREILLGLQDVKLINDVFNMYVDLDYLNDNQNTILEMYKDMRGRYLSDIRKATEPERKNKITGEYCAHLGFLEGQIKDLCQSIRDAENVLITVLAKTRLSLAENIIFKQVFGFTSKHKREKVIAMRDQIKREMRMGMRVE